MKKNVIICCLSFFIPIILLLLGTVSSHIFPFGTQSFIEWDSELEFVEALGYFKSLFTSDNDIFYSFSKIGGNWVLDYLSFYCASPLNFISLFFPEKYLHLALYLITILKIGLCGLTFSYLVNKVFNLSYKSIFFAVTYALCGYNLIYIPNIIFYDGIYLLPLIALGIISLVKQNRYFLYIFALALSIISNSFTGYIVIVFGFFLFIYELLQNKFETSKELAGRIKTYCFSTLTSLLLTAWLLIPIKYSLSVNAKYEFFDIFNRLFFFRTDIIPVLSKFYTGSVLENQFWLEQIPFVFIGILCLLFFILYFFNKTFSVKERIITFCFFIFLFLSFSLNCLFVLWNMGVEEPNGTIFRFGFIFPFFTIFIAAKSFKELDKLTLPNILLTGFIFILMSVIVYLQHYSYTDYFLFSIDVLSVFVFLSLLYLAIKKPKLTALFLSVAALIHFYNLYVNTERVIASQRGCCYSKEISYFKDYSESMQEVLSYIKAKDKSFYRLDTYTSFVPSMYDRIYNNMSMLFGYNSISNYSSLGNLETKDFLTQIGYPSFFQKNNLQITYLDSLQIFPTMLMGVKYLISTEPSLGRGFEKIYTSQNTTFDTPLNLFKNPYALPVGIIIDNTDKLKTIKEKEVMPDFQNNLIKIISNKDFGNIYSYTLFPSVSKEIETKDRTLIPLSYKATSNENLYLVFQKNQEIYYPVLDIIKNNELFGFYSNLLNFNIYYLGNNQNNRQFDFYLLSTLDDSNFDYNKFKIYFMYENTDILKKYYDELTKNTCNLSQLTSSHLKGHFEIREDNKLLLLTIPYDKNWVIKIDGEVQKQIKVLNMLTGIKVEKGSHTIEMRYRQKGFLTGSIISGLTLIILTGILIRRRKKND